MALCDEYALYSGRRRQRNPYSSAPRGQLENSLFYYMTTVTKSQSLRYVVRVVAKTEQHCRPPLGPVFTSSPNSAAALTGRSI